MGRIYLDHAATTPVDPRVLEAMQPFFSKKFGNASSLHSEGTEAAEALEKSRETVAGALGAKPDEVVFTSGGSESDNLAIKGFAYANRKKGNRIVTSAIEHPAVLNTCRYLEKNGFRVTYVPVGRNGIVDLNALEKAVNEETILVSIMHANNEIGTIQPLGKISEIAKRRGVALHTDAVQTFGKIETDADKLGADLLSLSGHKIYGPKGVGALFVRKGTVLEPLTHGGEHEKGLRAGTENVAGIAGLAEATRICAKEMNGEAARETRLRDRLLKGVLETPGSWLNGHRTKRLPNNANFSFRHVEGESLVLYLDMKGIAASTGSACSSLKLEPSHVLRAIGLTPEEAHGSLRLTLGRATTAKDIETVLEIIPGEVEKLRKISPLAGMSALEKKRLEKQPHGHGRHGKACD